jgi:hypothetical protein
MAIELRPARREDAADLARLVDLAGEGLPSYLWAGMAEPGRSLGRQLVPDLECLPMPSPPRAKGHVRQDGGEFWVTR